MIKINLLETAKGKGKRGGGAAVSMPSLEMGDMGSPKLKVLIMVVLVGAINYGYWYRLDRQGKAIAKQMKDTVSEPPKDESKYECLGDVAFEGKTYTAYRTTRGPEQAAGARPRLPSPDARIAGASQPY